jgi:hypothetical protein
MMELEVSMTLIEISLRMLRSDMRETIGIILFRGGEETLQETEESMMAVTISETETWSTIEMQILRLSPRSTSPTLVAIVAKETF